MNMRATDWLWTLAVTLIVASLCALTQLVHDEWTPPF